MSSPVLAPCAAPAPLSLRALRVRPSAGPLRGVLLLILALMFFSVSDITAKYLNRSLPSIEICWLRYAGFSLILLPLLLKAGRPMLRTASLTLQLARGAAMAGSALLFIFATRYLPLADATATSFVSPAFITALSIPLLGERVGWHRWGALAAGLAGVLIVTRPGGNGFHWASLLPLASAGSWAMAVVLTRRMGRADAALTTLFYTAVPGFLWVSLLMPMVAVWPDQHQVALGCLIAAASAMGQMLVLEAYRSTDASLLAPFGYSQLLWSAGLGFIVFGALPDRFTVAGAAVIVAGGLIMARQESRGRQKPGAP